MIAEGTALLDWASNGEQPVAEALLDDRPGEYPTDLDIYICLSDARR